MSLSCITEIYQQAGLETDDGDGCRRLAGLFELILRIRAKRRHDERVRGTEQQCILTE